MANTNDLINITNLVQSLMAKNASGVQAPVMPSASEFQSKYGLNFNLDPTTIESMLNDATNSAYDAQLNSQTASEKAFAQLLAQLAGTTEDTIRAQYGENSANNNNEGALAAQLLSNMLGLQQNTTDDITKLIDNRSTISDARTNQLLSDKQTAMDSANMNTSTLASLIKDMYQAQTQAYAAGIGNDASNNTDQAGTILGMLSFLGGSGSSGSSSSSSSSSSGGSSGGGTPILKQSAVDGYLKTLSPSYVFSNKTATPSVNKTYIPATSSKTTKPSFWSNVLSGIADTTLPRLSYTTKK